MPLERVPRPPLSCFLPRRRLPSGPRPSLPLALQPTRAGGGGGARKQLHGNARARARAHPAAAPGHARGKRDDDGGDVVVVDWQWPCREEERKIRRKWWRKNTTNEGKERAGPKLGRRGIEPIRSSSRSKSCGTRPSRITVKAKAADPAWNMLFPAAVPGAAGWGGPPGPAGRLALDDWSCAWCGVRPNRRQPGSQSRHGTG